ncbi:MAG: UDP-N-acetylglucosamine 1-carboxyvinyltransferase [Acidobacteria bacterium]|nr:UDP-N-acetylglucosamine 1-carboxyvinyltransferase [Acidobacteriota bacterium]NIM61263.1 UDP-N-acetylglucosamine 1-carboxyvinyltransferase [Acidobacteriota bacterium]NIQ86666.1 UDP-N-acetylglucosamine 1-carboxyvinyltransferase [Acidobacteriota bacterium]NIT12023.1 UDP-N-acetylglucosamine 1-carboxyvinyltransferase [Acidobacteriota bacterium]
MDKLRVAGGQRLSGRVAIAGAKNAALPALAACLLTDEPVRLSNLPDVVDVRTMLRVLEQLGAQTTTLDGGVEVSIPDLASHEAPYDLVRKMRASVLVLGPILAREGRARVSLPGGCAIGERPINLHIDGLTRMGAQIEIDSGYVEARADRLHGAEIAFPHKTVTGTENLMMAAALAEGTTVLRNAAQEPEIVDLAELLCGMGASVRGAGSDVIEIDGRGRLGGTEHRVIPDRIETGTYLVAAALMGDDVTLTGCRPDQVEPILDQLRATGVKVGVVGDALTVSAPNRLTARDLRTAPHPGFPTDMQAQYMALMTQAHGTAVITETVFEHRFMHVAELLRMGADIRIDGHTAVVVGPRALTGAQVMATDLRASACLVLAALVAAGTTTINRIYHLDRGYEAIETKLGALGASVERIR